MGHLKEPLKVTHRPLVFYAMTEILRLAAQKMLALTGFKSLHHSPTSFSAKFTSRAASQRLMKTPSPVILSSTPEAIPMRFHVFNKPSGLSSAGELDDDLRNTSPVLTPIVILHGVGVGLIMYVDFIQQMCQTGKSHFPLVRGQLLPIAPYIIYESHGSFSLAHSHSPLHPITTGHPVVVFEHPWVSLQSWALLRVLRVPDTDEVAAGVAAALRSLGFPPACIVAHSYGSLVASRLMKLHPDLVHSTALIDPGRWEVPNQPSSTYQISYQIPLMLITMGVREQRT